MDVDSNSIKSGLKQDLISFFDLFSTFDRIQYNSFNYNWNKFDISLLTLVSPSDSIIQILIQMGLFNPTRPFRDHQLLVFFLYNIFKSTKKPLKLFTDKIQILIGVGLRSKVLSEPETFEALQVLFKKEAFLILADDKTNYTTNTSSGNTGTTAVSVDQILDRIRRIESFLQSRPLFDQKLSKNSLIRLKSLFEKYQESKASNNFILNSSDQNDGGFEETMAKVMKIVDSYERLVLKFTGSVPNKAGLKNLSVRSRLTQSSLTPIIPASTPLMCLDETLSPDFFMTDQSSAAANQSRSQSVPPSKSGRRSSALRENAFDEFIETSTSTTNMPNINFY